MHMIVKTAEGYSVVKGLSSEEYAVEVYGKTKISDLHRCAKNVPRSAPYEERPWPALIATAMCENHDLTVAAYFDRRATFKTSREILKALAVLYRDPLLLGLLE